MAERFLTLREICQRVGYTPSTVHNYRSLGLALKLPPLRKRGDGKLGCMESVLDAYLRENYLGGQE